MSLMSDPTTAPAPTKPLLEWYRLKKEKRDLLCLATTLRGWNYSQEPNTMAETILTEAEYDAAIAEVRDIHRKLVTMTKPASSVVVACHPALLIGCIFKRPTKVETDRLTAIIGDDSINAEDTKIHLANDFVQRCLWPEKGSEAMAQIMETAPFCIYIFFPQKVLESTGADRIASKSVG